MPGQPMQLPACAMYWCNAHSHTWEMSTLLQCICCRASQHVSDWDVGLHARDVDSRTDTCTEFHIFQVIFILCICKCSTHMIVTVDLPPHSCFLPTPQPAGWDPTTLDPSFKSICVDSVVWVCTVLYWAVQLFEASMLV